MKKSTKSSMKKPVVKKAQMGKSVKASADSTDYFGKKATKDVSEADKILSNEGYSKEYRKAYDTQMKSLQSLRRQSKKGKPGYDENGFPINKFKPKSPQQQISEGMKKKMKSGGVVKAKKK